MPKDRLLEWSAADGWGPLCEFLDKDVPKEPFPHVNTKDKGWKEREDQIMGDLATPAMRNFGILVITVVGGLVAAGVRYYRR